MTTGSHKAAYDLLELMRKRTFAEVHSLDRYGVAYYATLAKHLGLHSLDTTFAIHVVGGTVFHTEVEDRLLDNVGSLENDVLERGSLERADVVLVHDRRAWRWYTGKFLPRRRRRSTTSAAQWPLRREATRSSLPAASPRPLPTTARSAPTGGSRCSATRSSARSPSSTATSRLVRRIPETDGEMDAVTYIHLRTARWGVPITIRRDLSIADEIAFLSSSGALVFCDSRRRDGLRARLVPQSGLEVLRLDGGLHTHVGRGNETLDNPGRLARAIVERVASGACRPVGARTRSHCGAAPSTCCPRPAIPHPGATPGSGAGAESERLRHPLPAPSSAAKRARIAEGADLPELRSHLVDDGSPDPDVRRELEEIRQEVEPRGWRVIVQENRYLGAARNHAARHATGDYLLFMDDDNLAMPHELSTLVAAALRTGADIVTTFFDGFEEDEDVEAGRPIVRFAPFGAAIRAGYLHELLRRRQRPLPPGGLRADRRFHGGLRHHPRGLGAFLPGVARRLDDGLRSRAALLVPDRRRWHVPRGAQAPARGRQPAAPHQAIHRAAPHPQAKLVQLAQVSRPSFRGRRRRRQPSAGAGEAPERRGADLLCPRGGDRADEGSTAAPAPRRSERV